MIKAVIFDMNGVISNDEKLHKKAYQQVLSKYDVDLNDEKYEEQFMGSPNMQNFKKIVDEYNMSVSPQQLNDEKSELYMELAQQELEPVKGAIEAVEKFSKKYILGLVSSSYAKEVEMVLNKFAIKKYFSALVTADDVSKGKPDPEPYLLVAEKLNIKPENCVVFEDSLNGIKAAKTAGMKVISLSTTYSWEDLSNSSADMIIDNFDL